MADQKVDERLFGIGSYILFKGTQLLRVDHVREIGVFPNKTRLVSAEDAKTSSILSLTENQVAECEFVCQGEPSDEETIGPVAA